MYGLLIFPRGISARNLFFRYNSAVIDRTALFVARSANPPQFEDKIREGHRSDPKFSFLNPADPYHAYYRHKMDKIFQGDTEDEPTADKDEKDASTEANQVNKVDIGVEPPPPVWIMDLPHISSIDLYVYFSTRIRAQLILIPVTL